MTIGLDKKISNIKSLLIESGNGLELYFDLSEIIFEQLRLDRSVTVQ